MPSKPVPLTAALYVTVTIVLACVTLILAGNLWMQYGTYHSGLQLVHDGATADQLSGTLVLSRAWDFAVIKTCSLFLAFTLIFVGALYVLRQNEQAYEAHLESVGVKAALQTSSPGLVLATLGVVLVIATLFSTSTIQLEQRQSAGGTEQLTPAPQRGATTDAR